MKKFMLLIILPLSFVMTSCNINTKTSGTEGNIIYMGTNAEFTPFEYVVDDGVGVIDRYDGIDVAIVKQIADNLGYTVKIEDMPFESLIYSLDNNRIDFIASALSITEEREKAVNFTIPYFEVKQLILVKEDNNTITNAQELRGKTVGVQQGNTADFILSDNFKDVTVRRYNRPIDAVFELRNGEIDAILIDELPAKFIQQNDSLLKIIDDSDAFDTEYYGIAFNKNNEQLLNKFNEELEKMSAAGDIEKIINQYID